MTEKEIVIEKRPDDYIAYLKGKRRYGVVVKLMMKLWEIWLGHIKTNSISE